MTRIFFYHNAPDRIAAAARLLAGAYRQGKPVLVYAPEPGVAADIDRQLWLEPATGFIPHVRAESPLAAETPIVITADPEAETGQAERLLNLSPGVPPAFSRFASLVEVVGQGNDERRAGRERARFYKDRGYAIQYIDLAETPA
ncbi:MAG: DNA polymerase III subunit chi [Candidatus Accumulibacter sp.]|nr:DNA polymerase III subunit chi [Accumulibacter sp.]